MKKSNITIASNIYVRKNPQIEKDPGFAHRVSGYKFLGDLKKRLHGFSAQLSPVQEEEIKETARCVYNTNGETTHGKILMDGEIVWACRCENISCNLYEECMSTPYAKKAIRPSEDDTIEEEFYEEPEEETEEEISHIDQPAEADEDEFAEEEIGEEISEEEPSLEIPETVLPEELPDDVQASYKRISEPAIIIEAPIGSRILVNAGPGTGKTYTVIERLRHIIQNEMTSCEDILVLCYTNAAKSVIMERIEAGVKEGTLPGEARRTNVNTFDSLASYYLYSIDEEISGLDYDKRIERFNVTAKPEVFSSFKYVIIDELQDLVNHRALMTLKILESLSAACGFLLLGDKCQAIYDYDCREVRNSIGSEKFYQRLEKFLPAEVQRYELTGNRRQSQELARFSEEMRNALLTLEPREANKTVAEVLAKWPASGLCIENVTESDSDGRQSAILCRSNGEAEYVSAVLRHANITHDLLRSPAIQSVSLNRWYGDMFWDYIPSRIGEDDFAERYRYRVNDDEAEAGERFRQLCQLCEAEDNGVLEMALLHKKLARLQLADIPAWMRGSPASDLYVSTIHKAKGREFDNVYILESAFAENSDDKDEAKVRYVAATRPKNELEIIKSREKWFCARLPSGRVLRTIRRQYKKWKFCGAIVVGLAGDVDAVGFVDESLGNPIERQRYIAEKIHNNDLLEIRLEHDKYLIYHEENAIGYLSGAAKEDFWRAVKATDVPYNIPSKLENIYVSNITTVLMTSFSENIPLRFRESRVWLGIEISGFARAVFPKRAS